MIKKLLLATNNEDKVTEIKKLLSNTGTEVISLNEANIKIEIEEDKPTLEGNALKKAEQVYLTTGIPCIADDTGLFVESLNGEPGVFSSRYAGIGVSYADNRRKLLKNLEGIPNEKRTAHFSTVVCFYLEKTIYYIFEGVCAGKILTEERGNKGFGYDAIFLPDGYDKTFAELDTDEKNKISHRAKAFGKFRDFFIDYNSKV